MSNSIDQNLFYSAVHGQGVYTWKNMDYTMDPATQNSQYAEQEREKRLLAPVFTNILTGEQFYVKRAVLDRKYMLDRERYIWKRPGETGAAFIWPCDMIESWEEGALPKSILYLNREYTDRPRYTGERMTDCLLLYPMGVYSGLKNLSDIVVELSSQRRLSWKNESVRSIAVGILKAVESLNRSGYVFCDFHVSNYHPSRFCLKGDGEIVVDHSNMIYHMHEEKGTFELDRREESRLSYPVEFADPSVANAFDIEKINGNLQTRLDYHSQNYSLAAFLFYLFFGVHAYEGKVMKGKGGDLSLMYHYNAYRTYYLKMPAFIFDDQDQYDNDIGDFEEDQMIIRLWNDAPDTIRRMFLNTLRWDNALRLSDVNNPTPSEWLDVLEALSWIKAEGGAA